MLILSIFKVAKKLIITTPSLELVDAYLVEIAKGYSVVWTPTPSREAATGDDPDSGVKVSFRAIHGK